MSELVTTLADYTLPELMVPTLASGGTAAVIGELCSALERAGRVQDVLAFYNAVVHRELMCSSATPGGWALPHARLPCLPLLSFAVGRTATDLNWLEEGGPPVRLVVLCAVPEGDANYLRLLSGLARLSQDAVRLQDLLRAPDAQAMYQVLQQVPFPRPPSPRPVAKA